MQQSSSGVDTNYTLELNSGLSQVLADGTNTYLYGMNRLGMSTTTGNYLYEYDALGSVRQMENIAGLTLAESYDPYGNVILSSGQAGIYGYTGEEQDSYTGLVNLRARTYSPSTGTFLSRDTWDGDVIRPLSLGKWNYVEQNPITRSDPSGLSWSIPFYAMCFGNVMSYGNLISQTAQEAVDMCKIAYDRSMWGFSISQFHDLPKTSTELFAWYINEYGDEHLYFNGDEPLTNELATTKEIHQIRMKYYDGEDVRKGFYKFNGIEFISALFDIQSYSVPISHFIGSFYYQIIELPNQRVGIRIDNDTTLKSGTHFPGRFNPNYKGSVEEIIDLYPSLQNEPVDKLINEKKLLSILKNQKRQTIGNGSAGNMYQTYVWTEKNDPCLNSKLLLYIDRNTLSSLLDIEPWYNFSSTTRAIDY